MPKVTITNAKGMEQVGGKGLELDQGPVLQVSPLTADTTVSLPGVYTLDKSSAITVTMPAAANVPGGIFTFRTISSHTAHDLTGSDSGTVSFAGVSGSVNGNVNEAHHFASYRGGAMALAPRVGASLTLYCDGARYLVMASSGSLAFSGLQND